MPWEHCEQEIHDDTPTCPGCGITKEQWTVEVEVTRTFQVARKPVIRFELHDGQDEPVEGEPYQVELPDGSSQEGELDEMGFARVISPQEGDCTLSFPNRAAGAVRLQGEDTPPANNGPARFVRPTAQRKYVFQVSIDAVSFYFHHLLDVPHTKDDTVTLLTDDDEGQSYLRTYQLSTSEHVVEDEQEPGYLRVEFAGIVPDRPYALKIDPGVGAEGQTQEPYYLIRNQTLPKPTDQKPLPADLQVEGQETFHKWDEEEPETEELEWEDEEQDEDEPAEAEEA